MDPEQDAGNPRAGGAALLDITRALRADELRPAWRALTIAGLMVCASAPVFAAVSAILASAGVAPVLDAHSVNVVLPMLRYALAGVSLIAVAASLAMGAVVWRASLRQQAAETTGRSGSLLPIVTAYMRSTMIAMAMAETPAIFGLILFLMGGEWAWPIGFWFVSFVVNAARFPTITKLAIRLEVVMRELG